MQCSAVQFSIVQCSAVQCTPLFCQERTEDLETAQRLDELVGLAWSAHINYHKVDNSTPFEQKLQRACSILQGEMLSSSTSFAAPASSSSTLSLPATERCLLVVARQRVFTAAGRPMTVAEVLGCWQMLGDASEPYCRGLLEPLDITSVYSRKGALGQLLSVKSRKKAVKDMSPEQVTNCHHH